MQLIIIRLITLVLRHFLISKTARDQRLGLLLPGMFLMEALLKQGSKTHLF